MTNTLAARLRNIGLGPFEADDWRLSLTVAGDAPMTGMVTVCSRTVLAVQEALDAQAAQIAAQGARIAKLQDVADAAGIYYQHYMQDEAESPEDCVCGESQHRRAKAVRDTLAALRKEQGESRNAELTSPQRVNKGKTDEHHD